MVEVYGPGECTHLKSPLVEVTDALIQLYAIKLAEHVVYSSLDDQDNWKGKGKAGDGEEGEDIQTDLQKLGDKIGVDLELDAKWAERFEDEYEDFVDYDTMKTSNGGSMIESGSRSTVQLITTKRQMYLV